VHARLDELLGQPQVVIERVELFPRRRQIAGTTACVCNTASIAGRIRSTSLSASNTRKISTPVFAASLTNALATESG
jgi:hypothetical protein